MYNVKTKHHVIPKDRKRKRTVHQNQVALHIDTTITLYRMKHEAWHYLFKNMTLDEIIECLQRIRRLCFRKQHKQGKRISMNDQYYPRA